MTENSTLSAEGTSPRRKIVPSADTPFPGKELLKRDNAGKTVSLIETVYRKTVLYPMLLTCIYTYLIRREMRKMNGQVEIMEFPLTAKGGEGINHVF